MKKTVRPTRRQLIAKKEAVAKQLVAKANAVVDLLASLPNYQEYKTKDGQTIKLSCVKAKEASPEVVSWVFDIMERNMKELYEQSQWGWDPAAKQSELTEPPAQYLIASCEDQFLGFSHFRFDTDDKVEVLYCYELQLEMSARRKGLGRFMMSALEAIAAQNKMQKVVLTVLKHNPSAMQFFCALGYKLDKTSPPASDPVDYVILSKQNLQK